MLHQHRSAQSIIIGGPLFLEIIRVIYFLRSHFLNTALTIHCFVLNLFTELGTTVGFQFAFSLFPGKIYRGKNLELRTTEEFRWEYSYNNEEPVAEKYPIGNAPARRYAKTISFRFWQLIKINNILIGIIPKYTLSLSQVDAVFLSDLKRVHHKRFSLYCSL